MNTNRIFLTLLLVIITSGFLYAQKVISPDEFHSMVNDKAAVQLIDVRTEGEYAGGHLAHAKNIDIRSRDFAKQMTVLDKNQPVYVYCLSGGRSASAARQLAGMGFTEVYDMQGGIMAWKRSGLPLADSSSKETGMTRTDYNNHINSQNPVLVDFYAPWCAPCRKMAPMLDELVAEYGDKFTLLKLDADKNDALLKELDVNEIPTFFIYKDGTESWKHIGQVQKEELLKELGL